MVQYRAVNHGANEAAPGDHDEAIFMNSGVLGVTVKVTDFDGDAVTSTRDISGTISIDDDGPHATCDYDSVTEGRGQHRDRQRRQRRQSGEPGSRHRRQRHRRQRRPAEPGYAAHHQQADP
jgi:hypothetical protein